MNNQQRHATLVQAISAASAAHADYEATVLQGVYDTAWAEWYARHLLAHGWNDLFPRPWSESELASALQQAHLAHRAAASNQPWQEFYADRFSSG